MKILQINSTDLFSTGNIMLSIANITRLRGYEAYTASKYQKMSIIRKKNNPHHFYIGNRFVNTMHRYFSWITDLQDCGSIFSTITLIKKIEKIKPEIIHLHDIVGWYVNIDILFKYLKRKDIPIIWTFHDCWSITGRCIHFDLIGCNRWKTGCGKCPQKKYMPGSWFFDFSAWNYKRKERLFTGINNMTIITPSEWLKNKVKQSFLKKYDVKVINNGIDLEYFKPTEGDLYKKIRNLNKKVILGVAGTWSKRKGLDVFLQMAKVFPEDYVIILVGLSTKELSEHNRIIAIERTHNKNELAQIYTAADVFANPTLEDTFPTVNLEALACGTPIVTYKTGGSPESVDSTTGIVVEKNNIEVFFDAVKKIASNKSYYKDSCLLKAQDYNMNDRFNEYVDLYEQILKQ